MPKFPEPPAVSELANTRPERKILPRGTVLWRLYFRGGKHPTFWDTFRSYGPTRNRFDGYPKIEGLYYSSSMAANRPCFALYERAISAMPSAPAFHRSLSDPTMLTLLRNVARDLGYILL